MESSAIQGVSNASRSARLLNAKQTVQQIKIKGSKPGLPGPLSSHARRCCHSESQICSFCAHATPLFISSGPPKPPVTLVHPLNARVYDQCTHRVKTRLGLWTSLSHQGTSDPEDKPWSKPLSAVWPCLKRTPFWTQCHNHFYFQVCVYFWLFSSAPIVQSDLSSNAVLWFKIKDWNGISKYNVSLMSRRLLCVRV